MTKTLAAEYKIGKYRFRIFETDSPLHMQECYIVEFQRDGQGTKKLSDRWGTTNGARHGILAFLEKELAGAGE